MTGLAAGGAHVELLAQRAAKFHVPTVAIFYKEAVPALREALEQVGAGNVNITAGPDAVIAMAGSGADVVLARHHRLHRPRTVHRGTAGRLPAGI